VIPDEAAPLRCHRDARMPVEQLDWRARGATLDADFDAWLAADRARLRLAPAAADARHADPRDGRRVARGVDASSRAARRLEHRAPACRVLRDYRDPDAVSPFEALRYRDFIAWLGTRERGADERFWTGRSRASMRRR
jgi:hypothetical protein